MDVTRYGIEECLAATQAADPREAFHRDSTGMTGIIEPFWRDTLEETAARAAEQAREPLHAWVTDVARRCGARFAAASAPLADFALVFALYLAANRDADAATLVTRRLKAVTAEREHVAVLDTIIHAYLGQTALGSGLKLRFPLFTHPGRLAAAESLITELARLKSATWQMRFGTYGRLGYDAWDAGDTVRARRAYQAQLAIAATLTDAERRSNEFQGAAVDIHQALKRFDTTLLDSLRHSTAAYAAYYRALWAKATGGVVPQSPIGEPAPMIEGDFWFRRGDSRAGRPVEGKVNLVVFLNQATCYGGGSSPSCQMHYARLRRLAQRFPALEVTLVAQTLGWFWVAALPAPAEELALLERTWLEERKLPGALAVTNTPFWRLPDPDRRRVNRKVANVTHYSFGGIGQVAADKLYFPASAVLIDQSGRVIDFANSIKEHDLVELIEVLLARQMANRP